MEYSIYIMLDKTLKHDYGVIEDDGFGDKSIKLIVYTNGEKKIDFKELCYFTYDESFSKRFINFFAYGRKVINNAKAIHVEKKLESNSDKNTREDNLDIIKLLELNKKLISKKIFVSVGSIGLNKEDMDSLEPLKGCKYASVMFDETGLFHTVGELEKIYYLVDFVIKKIEEQDFSPIEKVLYAYDIIRTDFIIDKRCEEKMEEVLDLYTDPSFCYSLVFNEVLKRLDIKCKYAFGDFTYETRRAFNIAYIIDEDYDIEGVYYFDISNNSKQKFENSLKNIKNDSIKNSLINNYAFFSKTKGYFEERGILYEDYTFDDFDEIFMEELIAAEKNYGINGVYDLRGVINSVGYFIDGHTIIDNFLGIKDQDELDDIKEAVERYSNLFGKDISGEDFLEILFNVRQVEYKENKELFPLSIEDLKTSLFNSNFALSNMVSEFSEEKDYEQEDIDEVLQEAFDYSFEETIYNNKMEERINKLKLSLNKDNKPRKDDNN